MQNPLLSINSVTKKYGASIVLDQISLTIAQGEAIGILGPNGAGKTTLLKIISGQIQPTKGSVWFDGEDVSRLPEHKRCKMGICRTNQIPQPFLGMSVWENILVAAQYGGMVHGDDAQGKAFEALRSTGMEKHAESLVDSLPLLARKRLELARAIACQPKLLLLDEIAGGLSDYELEELVIQIQKLKSDGITIIWIEHILHALMTTVDRVVALDFGLKVTEGSLDEVMDSKQFKEAYFGVDEPVGHSQQQEASSS